MRIAGPPHPGRVLESLAFEVGSVEMRLGVLDVNSRAVAVARSQEAPEETTPSWRMVLGPDARLGVSLRLYAIGAAAKG